MLRYIVKRLIMFIPIIIGVTLIAQVLIALAPGDPARALVGNDPRPGDYERVRAELRLDEPLLVRYWAFMSNAVRGDFGISIFNKRPVMDEILLRWPYTATLSVLSVLLSTLIGIPLGIFAATHQYKISDNLAVFVSLIAVSMPSFWFALLLVQFLAVNLRWLPVSGITELRGWVLPMFSLSLGYAASITRQMRSNMLEVIRQDFIITARAKGQTERKVLYKHAMKNALIPVIQTIGGIFGMAIGGALITEMIFSIPGLGMYTLTGLQNRDYPVIQGNVLFLSMMFCVVILLIDLAFAYVDPRIRSQFTVKKRSLEKDGVER